MIFLETRARIFLAILVKAGKCISSAQCNSIVALMINETYIILSLMYNQFIFKLLVGRKCNLFVISFAEYVHWKAKLRQCPAQILAALLKVTTIIFKRITMFIISASKLRIRLCLLWLNILDRGSSKEKKRQVLHMSEILVSEEACLKPCPTVQEAAVIMAPPSAKSGWQSVWMW